MSFKKILKEIGESSQYTVSVNSKYNMTITFKNCNRSINIVNTHGNYFDIQEKIIRENSEKATNEDVYMKVFGNPNTKLILASDILDEMSAFKDKYPECEAHDYEYLYRVLYLDRTVQPSTFWLLIHGYDYYDNDMNVISVKYDGNIETITRNKVVKIKNNKDIQKQIIELLGQEHLQF